MAKEPFKIKSSTQLSEMIENTGNNDLELFRPIIEYIESLENVVQNYQSVLNQINFTIESHNVNAKR